MWKDSYCRQAINNHTVVNYLLKILLKYLFVATLLAAASTSVFSKEAQLNDAFIPSLADFTRGDGFAQSIGVKFTYEAVYRGSDQYVVEVTLEGATQWRSGGNLFFIENYDLNGIELGWRNFIRPGLLLQSGLRHETVLPSGKTQQANINDFPHRGSHAFAFFELRRALDGEWRNWMAARVSGGPSDFGLRAEISYGHQFFLRSYGSGAEIEVFSTFGDEEQIDSYFGVSQSDANTSGLPLTNFGGGYRSSGFNATYRKALNRNVQITVRGRMEVYSREIENSSLVKDASEASIDTSITYRF